MRIGAVIVLAGLNDKASIPVGKLSAAQRMAAVFQKIGADAVAVVTDAEDKQLEKQLSQSGAVLIPSGDRKSREAAAEAGLERLSGICERIFLLDADRPLVMPETLRKMLAAENELVVPTYGGQPGKPLLFSGKGAEKALSLHKTGMDIRYIPVEDEGVLLNAENSKCRLERIAAHDSVITRPILDVSIQYGSQIIDKRLISLLAFIDETQSVREACGRIHISYSTAWNMLNRVEDELGYTLVNRNKGGASGSGTVLTDKGKKILDAYIEFEAQVRDKAHRIFDRFFPSA